MEETKCWGKGPKQVDIQNQWSGLRSLKEPPQPFKWEVVEG